MGFFDNIDNVSGSNIIKKDLQAAVNHCQFVNGSLIQRCCLQTARHWRGQTAARQWEADFHLTSAGIVDS